MAELIREDDTLNQGRKKLNNAIRAFNETVVEGDSSVEAAQARVDKDGKTYGTLKERLDTEHGIVTAQLAETEQEIKDGTRNFKTVDSPSFCFIDDDSTINVYTDLYPMFESKNAKFTIAVITGQIGWDNRMTEAQLLEMYNDGYDIMPHTHRHKNLTTLTEQEIIDDYE